jgi:hypothetical protein
VGVEGGFLGRKSEGKNYHVVMECVEKVLQTSSVGTATVVPASLEAALQEWFQRDSAKPCGGVTGCSKVDPRGRYAAAGERAADSDGRQAGVYSRRPMR